MKLRTTSRARIRLRGIALPALLLAVSGSPHHATGAAPIDAGGHLGPVARSVEGGPETRRGAFRVHAIEADRAFRLLPWNWKAEGTLVIVVSAPPGDHGLRAGDVILPIRDDPVGGVEALEAAARRFENSGWDLPLLVARSREILIVSAWLPQRTPDDLPELSEGAQPEEGRVEVKVDDPAAAEDLPPEFRASLPSEEGAEPESPTPPFFEEVGPDMGGQGSGSLEESLEEFRRRFEETTVTGEPGGGPDPETTAEIERIVGRYRSGTIEERMEAVLELNAFTFDWGLEISPHLIAALGDPDEGVRLAAAVVLAYDAFGGAAPEGDVVTQSVLSAAIRRPEPPLRSLAFQAAANMFQRRYAEPVLQEALVAALLDEDGEVRGSAQWALDALAY